MGFNKVEKKADKGSAVVIMDREKYVNEGMKQLSDPRFYRQVDSDLTKDHNQIVKDKLTFYKNRGDISERKPLNICLMTCLELLSSICYQKFIKT